jgi:hypothetical protein
MCLCERYLIQSWPVREIEKKRYIERERDRETETETERVQLPNIKNIKQIKVVQKELKKIKII